MRERSAPSRGLLAAGVLVEADLLRRDATDVARVHDGLIVHPRRESTQNATIAVRGADPPVHT